MPQNREFLKSKEYNKNKRHKYRIGTRSDGVSALSLTTKELLAVLANKDKAKYHANVIKVLSYRGNLNQ